MKVLKRQFHLLYDIICDTNIIYQLLEGRVNLCLRENIFSLKNLSDLKSGTLIKMMEGFYAILMKHIDYCKVKFVLMTLKELPEEGPELRNLQIVPSDPRIRYKKRRFLPEVQ
jgi:hypothetical protein